MQSDQPFVRPGTEYRYVVGYAGCVRVRRTNLYGFVGVGLVVGLAVLLVGPFPAMVNYLVGGAMLAVAVASVAALIVGFGGPEQRGPDF